MRLRILTRTSAIVTMAGFMATSVLGSQALALGNNRIVYRSCGSNYVSSGFNGTYYWAQTERVSGTCEGRFSLNFEMSDGRWMTRTYYNKYSAYRTISPSFGTVRNGLHWGCDNCNVTKS
jgi:hypothetical protein